VVVDPGRLDVAAHLPALADADVEDEDPLLVEPLGDG
jgi:hypothetical protein